MRTIQYPVFGICWHEDPWQEYCNECHGELAHKGTRPLQVTWLQWFLWTYFSFDWGLPSLYDDFGGSYPGVRE